MRNRSRCDVSPTPGVIAVMVSVYLPGRSRLVRDSQPVKRTVLSPSWPAKVSEPRRSAHPGQRRLRVVAGTHLPLRARPDPGLVKSKRTVAAVSSV